MFKKSKSRYVLSTLLFVFLFGTVVGFTQPKPAFKLDHFKVYEIDTSDCHWGVLLQGQFDKKEIPGTLTALTHFANPVEKTHITGIKTAITDTNAHLNWYQLRQRKSEPKRTILFQNQFGQYSINIKNPNYLLVPTQKTSHKGSKFPDSLDHFKCYKIIKINVQPPSVDSVNLKDQFGIEKNLMVREPVYFCVPVSKNLPGIKPTGKIINEKDHLVVYKITAKSYKKKIYVKDQFIKKPKELRVTRSVMLAVPTEKQAFTRSSE